MSMTPTQFVKFVKSNWNGDQTTLVSLLKQFFNDLSFIGDHDIEAFMASFGFGVACNKAFNSPDTHETQDWLFDNFLSKLFDEHFFCCSKCGAIVKFKITNYGNIYGLSVREQVECFDLSTLPPIAVPFDVMVDAINGKFVAREITAPVINQDVLKLTNFQTDTDGTTDGDCYFTIEREMVLTGRDLPYLTNFAPVRRASPRQVVVKFVKTYHALVTVAYQGTEALAVHVSKDFSSDQDIFLKANSQVYLEKGGEIITSIEANGDMVFNLDSHDAEFLRMVFALDEAFEGLDVDTLLKNRFKALIDSVGLPASRSVVLISSIKEKVLEKAFNTVLADGQAMTVIDQVDFLEVIEAMFDATQEREAHMKAHQEKFDKQRLG